MRIIPTIILAAMLAALAGPAWAADSAKAIPDLTQLNVKDVSKIPETPGLSWNLGPTGARGWMYGPDGNHGPLGSQILVTAVEKGSPAEKVLQPFDVLLGANGKPFTRDARQGLGQAVTDSETAAQGGLLTLTRWRGGTVSQVQLRLRVMGAYADTAPFACPKSKKIFDEACAFLASRMPPEGFHDIGGRLDALLLLASDRPEYLDHVRRTVARIEPPKHTGLSNWGWGYAALLLAEYYHATGDASVLPRLTEYCRALTDGQVASGGWGHNPAPQGWAEGYGEVNAVGLVCFTALVLSREAGVKVDEPALARSIAFFRRWSGRGNVPYGDHVPWLGGDDNGKTAQAAVAYDLLNDPAVAGPYASLVAMSWNEREVGHAGNFFSYVWGPLGVARAGRPALAEFMKHQRWYYDLARRWDGSLVDQPWPQRVEGQAGMAHYVAPGPLWGTGGIALAYALPQGRLRILGAAPGVFAHAVPAAIAPAKRLYDQKRFAECAAALKTVPASDDAAQLTAAAARAAASIDLTLAAIKADIDAGDLYMANCRLTALQSSLPAGDTRCAAWMKLLADPANEPILAAGKQYYDARQLAATPDYQFVERYTFEKRPRGQLTDLARKNKSGAYQKMAAKLLTRESGK